MSPGPLLQLARAHGAHRYAILFYTLLCTLAVSPLLSGAAPQRRPAPDLPRVQPVHGADRGPRPALAALSAYLLAGLCFGVLQWAIETAWPGSFVDTGSSGSTGLSLSTTIYYSFVTLATLGYGDVVPRTELARGIAVLEAVGGQLYVAVTIARLVGSHLQTPRTR